MPEALRENEPGLSAAEAAARLGVKRDTLYAYVSRGLLSRTVAFDGRTSRFDPAEIDRLTARAKRPPGDGELRTVIATELTRVDDQGLLVRGQDLVPGSSAGATFTGLADLLWAAPPARPGRRRRRPDAVNGGRGGDHRPDSPPLLSDALRLIHTALRSAADPLRHDLSPRSVRAVGRDLIVALCRALPVSGPERDRPAARLAGDLWARLPRPSRHPGPAPRPSMPPWPCWSTMAWPAPPSPPGSPPRSGPTPTRWSVPAWG